MRNRDDTISSYIAAWNDTRSLNALLKLQACVRPDVSYSDTFTSAFVGVERLAKTIVGIQQNFPEMVHALEGSPLFTEDMASYCWTATLKSGKVISGIDYVEFAADGLISKVISFTNKSDWQ